MAVGARGGAGMPDRFGFDHVQRGGAVMPDVTEGGGQEDAARGDETGDGDGQQNAKMHDVPRVFHGAVSAF